MAGGVAGPPGGQSSKSPPTGAGEGERAGLLAGVAKRIITEIANMRAAGPVEQADAARVQGIARSSARSSPGSIERPRRLTVSCFRQDVGEWKRRSMLEEAKACVGEVADLHDELTELRARMSEAQAKLPFMADE